MIFDKFDTITKKYDEELSLLKHHIIEAARYLGGGMSDEAIETLYFTRAQFVKTFLCSYDPGELLQMTRTMNSMYVNVLMNVTGVKPIKVSIVNESDNPDVLLQLDFYDNLDFIERCKNFTAVDHNISHESCCPPIGSQNFEG